MAGKNPYADGLGDFVIPPMLFDLGEWIADSYIDGETGQNCTLIYPDKWTQCDNCIFDISTGRSAGVYLSGGPQPFSTQLCPRCNGAGRHQSPVTDTIRMRVYWERKSWIDIGVKFADPDGVAMCIGYLVDLPKLERANTAILNSDIQPIASYECTRLGEAKPHGMRQNRYFIQYMKRTGSGG